MRDTVEGLGCFVVVIGGIIIFLLAVIAEKLDVVMRTLQTLVNS